MEHPECPIDHTSDAIPWVKISRSGQDADRTGAKNGIMIGTYFPPPPPSLKSMLMVT